MRPSEWCRANLRFNEPGNRGPFSTAGREYIIEPLDDWADMNVTDCVEVFGSQSGKTGMLMGGVAWSIVNDPCGLLWVMPSLGLAQSFSKTRWQSMLRSSPGTQDLIPSGARRHDFTNLEQHLGASVLNFVGSNSAANLASRPARKVVLDEVDKFDTGGREEADAVNLAEQRTKGQAYPQRRKTSTPTLVSGLIWQEFLKGDQRRYFVPCPLCGQHHPSSRQIVFAWSAAFTILPKTGCEAYIKWDDAARREDKEWDYQRVMQSARLVCPHCGGDILDGHKTKLIKAGEWKPTAKAELGFRSRHLSSLYACSPQTTFGKLAVKFLKEKRSLTGLQGFINGDLAEPYESQELSVERIEIISPPDAPKPEGAVDLLTFDYQLLSPHFWYVAASWSPGLSRVIDFGNCDTWEECADVQEALKITDNHVGVDSGKFAEEVYEVCLRHGKLASPPGRIPVFVGWTPMKGFGDRQRWTDKATGLQMPFFLSSAPLPHRRFRLPLLEFSGGMIKDMLWRMRRGKTKHRLEFSKQAATDEFFRHLDGEVRRQVLSKETRRLEWQWRPRSANWPNHGLDCMCEQVAMALFHKVLPWGALVIPTEAVEQIVEPSTTKEQ